MPIPTSPLQIDLLRLEDIPQLIACVQRCYGDSYPFKQIYSASALEKLISTKTMHSVVCKNENSMVVGHCSLTFSGSDNSSPELGKLFVDPDYRGHQIANLLANKLLNIARDLPITGFWSECVTNHPYSQDVLISVGGIEVGLLLGDIPATIKMQGENNFSDSRMSLLTYYVPSNKASPLNIFIPDSQAEHISALASKAGQERVIATTLSSGDGLSTFTENLDLSTLDANIEIAHIGKDFPSAIQAEIAELEMHCPASIYVDLPICNIAAASAYLTLERLGFFFASWLPGFRKNQDILRLQKIYTQLNESEIICARDQGEAMKAHVLTEMARVS
jgi:GNAT superfamily N-acetyltransferase